MYVFIKYGILTVMLEMGFSADNGRSLLNNLFTFGNAYVFNVQILTAMLTPFGWQMMAERFHPQANGKRVRQFGHFKNSKPPM
jgi:hypothetical protein